MCKGWKHDLEIASACDSSVQSQRMQTLDDHYVVSRTELLNAVQGST
jgi:hypothetical protein